MFRFERVRLPRSLMIVLPVLAAALFAAGCAGPAEETAQPWQEGGGASGGPAGSAAPEETLPPAQQVEEVFGQVAPPAWYVQPPAPEGPARLIPGTGTSVKSAEEALWLAEAHAKDEASNIAGALVRSAWKQQTRGLVQDTEVRVQEKIDYVTQVFSEAEITGASVFRREVREGQRLRAGKPAGVYFQGFALLKVPEENFQFTPERLVAKAHSIYVQGDERRALRILEGAALCWPGDAGVLERLAYMQEKAGQVGDGLETLRRLLPVCPGEKKAKVEEEIRRLERQYAGGEFAYLEEKLLKALKAAESRARLALSPLRDRAKAGEALDYTVLTDKAYSYFGIWVDEEGLFLYPAHSEDSGTRLGGDDGATHVPLDVGSTLGRHLFVLLAAAEQPEWFAEARFPRDLVNRRAADGTGRVPHVELARIIEDLEARAAAGTVVAASFAFDVVR